MKSCGEGNHLLHISTTHHMGDTHTHTGQQTHTETTHSMYADVFHLFLLTAVMSCGVIGRHQTTASIFCIPLRLTVPLPPSFFRPPVLCFHTPTTPPPPPPPSQHQPSRVCLSLAFISSGVLSSSTGIKAGRFDGGGRPSAEIHIYPFCTFPC